MNIPATQPTTSQPKNGGVPAAIRAFEGGRSQSTQVEQARAIAEVQAAVMVAMDRPRDEQRAIGKMREVCKIQSLAERAFFSFPRGGQTVSGESIHLARELARCWGNIDYGVKELSRNDIRGLSEMLAFAWDLETNTRTETAFIVPHMRDKKGGPVAITDMRDIYENNANQGARRVRECIFAVLPKWYTDEAVEICHGTLKGGGGKPLPQRRADLVAAFEPHGVTKAMIEKRAGTPVDQLNETQIAQLGIVFRSLKNGEVTRDEAFPETPAADIDKALKDKIGAPKDDKAAEQSGTAKMLIDKIAKCGSLKVLNAIKVDYSEDIEALSDADKQAVDAAFTDRTAQFAK